MDEQEYEVVKATLFAIIRDEGSTDRAKLEATGYLLDLTKHYDNIRWGVG